MKKLMGFLHLTGLVLVIFSLVVGFSAFAVSDASRSINKAQSSKLLNTRVDSASFLTSLRRNVAEMPTISTTDSVIKFNSNVSAQESSRANVNNKYTPSNNVPISSNSVTKAEDIKTGTFGTNVGGGDYWFPASIHTEDNAYLGGMLTINSGHILLLGSNKVIEWGNGAYIKQENNHLAFRSGGEYYFDNKVGIGTTNPDADLTVNGAVKANDFVTDNGKFGISEYYKIPMENGENCVMAFTSGLLTYSNCPLAQ